ncbi:hypothetical protein AgCh_035217 [Apium graveolens]
MNHITPEMTMDPGRCDSTMLLDPRRCDPRKLVDPKTRCLYGIFPPVMAHMFPYLVVGRNWSGAPNNPCRVKTIPCPIPEMKWYLTPSVVSIMGGLLPFGSIFIEIYFVFTLFWNYKNNNGSEKISGEQLKNLYKSFVSEYHVVSIEDPFDQELNMEFKYRLRRRLYK